MKNKYVKLLIKHKAIALGILSGILVIGLGFSIYKYKTDITTINNTNAEQIQNLNSQLSANSRTGYVATAEIKQGDILQDGVNVAANTFSSSADASTFATQDCLGQEAVVDIPNGSPITTNVVAASMEKQLNERECTFINLSANLKKGDFVDIRILFPNGEDPIVVSKVSIQNPVIASNLVYLWLTEDQITNLDSAVVDANLHGAIIYTTKYIEPEIQPANVVNYQPNAAVINLMQSDPNIVQEAAAALSVSARESLEDRLKAFEKAYPDFELDLKSSDDVDAALKSISDANAAGTAGANAGTNTGTNAGTNAGTTDNSTQGTSGTGTADNSTQNTTGTSNAGTDTSSAGAGSTDTTVTYGN